MRQRVQNVQIGGTTIAQEATILGFQAFWDEAGVCSVRVFTRATPHAVGEENALGEELRHALANAYPRALDGANDTLVNAATGVPLLSRQGRSDADWQAAIEQASGEAETMLQGDFFDQACERLGIKDMLRLHVSLTDYTK